ncbi:MAG: hypothetical protein WA888_04050 [Burkholderiaceae bacterium]
MQGISNKLGLRSRWTGVAGFLVTCAGMLSPLHLAAQTTTEPKGTFSGLKLGLVLDGSYASRELALGRRAKGLGLGHTELSASANIDDWFRGQATVALDNHEGELEVELEEAYLETLALPAGLTMRGGRFLSQIGYLNSQHLHTDDFAERPLLYRAFLGNHYFDDGIRLNYVIPTDFFWRVGVEAFNGGSLVGESTNEPSVGALTFSTRFGSDIGTNQSWQLGLGYLRNRLNAVEEADEDEADAENGSGDHDSEHGDEHGAAYAGKNMFIADLVWKWAPNGNNRTRQLRLSAEYARITDLSALAINDQRHEAWYLSAVYRFNPRWEAGVRFGDLKVSIAEDDEIHRGRLQETSLMLAYKRSEFSAFRLQFTKQNNKNEFSTATDSIMLQYVMSLGAHGAHSF